MIIVLFFIGIVVTILSSLYISWKAYRILNSGKNKFAGLLSFILFFVSLFGIGIIILFVWAELTGGFSRR